MILNTTIIFSAVVIGYPLYKIAKALEEKK